MTNTISEKTCIQFADALASSAPVPGGGGAAALVGAIGSCLCSMVGNLTTGKKKYAEYQEDIERMLAKAAETQEDLLELIDKDAAAFEPLQKAYSIPKDDPARAEVLEKVSIDACQAPLEMMRCICKTIDLLEEMLAKGNRGLVSDVGCGALCCKAALECASMNVFINTKSFDEDVVGDIEKEAEDMLAEYLPKAEATAAAVMGKIKRERLNGSENTKRSTTCK